MGVSFWPRVGARLIDLIVHSVVGFCATLFFAFLVGIAAAMAHRTPASLGPKLGHLTLAGFVFGLLGGIAYHSTCEGVHGSTVGKLALSMVVLQEDGSPCRLWPAVIRSLGYFVDALFFGVIGYFAMQKSPQQQRHGDAWAHTIVCKRSDAPRDKLRSGGMFVATLVMATIVDAALIIIGLLLDLV